MKKKSTPIMLTACAAALLSFGVWSCSKDHSTGGGTTLTEANAAQVTTDAVSPATGGLVAQVSSAATIAQSKVVVNGVRRVVVNSLPCGSGKDTTITYASVSGITPNFNYKLVWNYNFQCSAPTSVNLTFNGSGTYNGFVLGSQFASAGTFTLSGLDSTTYTYNSDFSRSGTIFSKTGAQNSFGHSLSITSSNIKYNTVTQEIASGTATVVIKLTNSAGSTFTFGGTITFEGNKTAKLVLNSGVVYTISWT